MKANRFFLSGVAFMAFAFASAQDTQPAFTWCRQSSGSTVPSNCLSLPIDCKVDGKEVEITGFSVGFMMNGSYFTKTVSGNTLPGYVADRLKTLEANETKVYLDEVTLVNTDKKYNTYFVLSR